MMALFTIVGAAAILASPLILTVDHAVRRSINPLGRRGGTRAEGGDRPGGEACGTPSAAPRRDVSRLLTPSFPVSTPGFEVARPESSRDGALGDSGRAPNVPS